MMFPRRAARRLALAGACLFPLSSALAGQPGCIVREPGLSERYAGACVAGAAHGQGLASGTEGRYQGEFRDGLREGRGIQHYGNGDIYAGQWRGGKRDGEGTYWFGKASPWAGDRYQGHWRQDEYAGAGKYTFAPSGDSYRADWQPGMSLETPSGAMVQRARAARDGTNFTIGQQVCSVTTPGAWPGQIARGTIKKMQEDAGIVLVNITDRAILAASPLSPPQRWERGANWKPCD
ncbi:MORN repeat-containing protein [Orrella dioscoreae]|nr:hypothetical protein [Orrella dioscoreae]